MTITMKPTEFMARMEGCPCRVWEGITDEGVIVKVFVDSIIIKDSAVVHSDDPPTVTVEDLHVPGPEPRMVRLAELFQNPGAVHGLDRR